MSKSPEVDALLNDPTKGNGDLIKLARHLEGERAELREQLLQANKPAETEETEKTEKTGAGGETTGADSSAEETTGEGGDKPTEDKF